MSDMKIFSKYEKMKIPFTFLSIDYDPEEYL